MILLCASKLGNPPAGLKHVPRPLRLLCDNRPGWALAANALFDAAAALNEDALFVDDDVTFLPETFRGLEQYADKVDVLGFKLLKDNRTEWSHVGYVWRPGHGMDVNPAPDEPTLACHVTASLMLVKAHVLKAGVRFPVWPGAHHEDTAFTYDCWLKGFRVGYCPLPAVHDMHEGMGGATKTREADFLQQSILNVRYLDFWCLTKGVREFAEGGGIPHGRQPF